MCARSKRLRGRPRRVPGGPTVAGACAPALSARGTYVPHAWARVCHAVRGCKRILRAPRTVRRTGMWIQRRVWGPWRWPEKQLKEDGSA